MRRFESYHPSQSLYSRDESKIEYVKFLFDKKEHTMNKVKLKRYILIILIIINCVIIFNFSSEKAEQSNESSGRVVNVVVELVAKTRNLSNEKKELLKEQIVKPIRKTAHFSVYASLGALVYLYVFTFSGKNKKKIWISLGLAFLYACSDEIHQYFVPGRSCEFGDVCIDLCGAMCGILIVYVVYLINRKVKNREK